MTIKQRMPIIEKILVGLVILGITSGFVFYLDVSSMMKVYEVDKYHNDNIRKELVVALKQLNKTISGIGTSIALQGQRIDTLEQDITELKVEH